MAVLNLSSRIYVDIAGYVFIKEINGWGPVSHLLLKITDIINLLERDIEVVIQPKWLNEIFLLVKQYNIVAKASNAKEAVKAEDYLAGKLNVVVRKREVDINKSNPFHDPTRGYERRKTQVNNQSIPSFDEIIRTSTKSRNGEKLNVVQRKPMFETLSNMKSLQFEEALKPQLTDDTSKFDDAIDISGEISDV